ncbi:YchJ family protein (plasmid) [Coraliomargarita sp. W4R53]
MSFGTAASNSAQGFPKISASRACPCGSGDPFGRCCQLLHSGEAAPTPERLMRSRYVAFMTGDEEYLAATWHPRTRPVDLTLDPQQRWERLEISESGESGDDGFVNFHAHWRVGGARGVLSERSRFRRAYGRWYYVDGDVTES